MQGLFVIKGEFSLQLIIDESEELEVLSRITSGQCVHVYSRHSLAAPPPPPLIW